MEYGHINVEWCWSCFCGHCFSSLLKRKKNRHWADEWYKGRPHYTHENLTSVKVERAERLQKLLRFGGPSCAELLESVTPTIAKRNSNMREAVIFSHGLFITLGDFDTVTLLQTWNSKVPHSMSPNHWNCAADMIAVRQTTHFFFQLHNMCYCVKQMKFEWHSILCNPSVITRRPVMLCHINYCTTLLTAYGYV